MEQITLGRTGFRVSRMGLGAGGHSRLGQGTGRSETESVALVHRAIERGINFIDTAEAYRTEEIVGRGIAGHDRSELVLSTKKALWGDTPVTAADLRAGLEQSLHRLGTDYVDVYHLHGLGIDKYQYAIDELVPEMLKLRQEGKIRAVGVTEAFNPDPGHAMLQRAMRDDCWDVIMVGFNILNQSARQRVLTAAREKNVGTLCMFAVRAALSRPERLREVVDDLIQRGQIDPSTVDQSDPLGFLAGDGIASSVTEAAYRFCRDEPGLHVILSGTGNPAHLDENIDAITQPPLPVEVRNRLAAMFARVDGVSGQ